MTIEVEGGGRGGDIFEGLVETFAVFGPRARHLRSMRNRCRTPAPASFVKSSPPEEREVEWEEEMNEGTRALGTSSAVAREEISECWWVGIVGFWGHEHVIRG